ncbi:hypothetical protein D7V97_11150 [Corallococcus sp. CA053C]|uniref:hypothetical protein n=1 Tax=Corallococcus sp. CA053C TaxID=2316732 RepID=UPI000EA03195|nr:hypothetical protein [Corallococcus sp. CA053C]RKH11476.1 hypothetical protein D7V97_11150 [Corallococcus sp. CA053C]
MRKLMKSLMAVSAVLSLAPTAAFARPPQCEDICFDAPCSTVCAVQLRQTTCNENPIFWGCLSLALPNDPSASVSTDEARQAEDASQVCSEEHPDSSAES